MSTNIKKKVLKYLSAMLSVFLMPVFGFFAVKLLPGAVSYRISENDSANEAGIIVKASDSINAVYEQISSVPEKNEYIIKNKNDEIYVFCENIPLYKIKAKISDFPANDVFLLKSGMKIPSKEELCEIVGYMES